MKKLATCLILLLTMALPLQSVASVSQIFCHTSSAPEDHHGHEHGHEMQISDEAHDTYATQDGTTVSSHQCSHCAQCCSAPALPVHSSAVATQVHAAHVWISILQQMHSDVEPRFLERPPRTPEV